MPSTPDRSTVVGVVSPGHMGSGLGAALCAGGASVLTTLAGRSERSVRRAAAAGLGTVGSLDELVASCGVILSVVPPENAVAVAEAVARSAAGAAAGAANGAGRPEGGRRVFVDLNAISPRTLGLVRDAVELAGFDLVDGVISGPPPSVTPGARVYLSGTEAPQVAALRWTGVEVVVLGDRVGDASALKMCSASVYKGTRALVVHALLTARANGVLEPLLDELKTGLGGDPLRATVVAATKAWRFVPEMREIAATQADAGLDEALFATIAGIYGRVAEGGYAGMHPEDVEVPRDPYEAVDLIFPE